jgi:hypothetical protein
MISTIALYSSHLGHGILLILTSGEVLMLMQFSKFLYSASGDRGFISKRLDVVGVMEHLVLLGVAPKSVVFIIFTFSLIALFFFLIVFFLMIVVVVVVLRQLLSFLRVFCCRYHDHISKESSP